MCGEGRQPRTLLPGPQLHGPIYPADSHRLPRGTECQSADRGPWGSEFLDARVLETEATEPVLSAGSKGPRTQLSLSTLTPALRVLPESYTGPSHLDDFESICPEEGNAASPAAGGYHLPLWVEGNAVQRSGTGVLEGQLSTDCVPELEKKEKRNRGAGRKWRSFSAPELLRVTLASPLPQ